jgi:hypothetical protein
MISIDKLRRFPIGKLFSYPHFNCDDSRILDKFWDSYPDKIGSVYYDVPLIDESLMPDTDIPAMVSDWRYLCALKIDLMILTIRYLSIIEVKSVLDMKAIGQIVSYRAKFPLVYDYKKGIKSIIVCDFARPELEAVCKILDIDVIFV